MAHTHHNINSSVSKKRAFPGLASADPATHTMEPKQHSDVSMSYSEDVHMSDQPAMAMFSMDDRKCPCLLCVQGPPLILQRESVAWTSIIRVAFYVLHVIYPDLSFLSMKTHVSPYVLRHWQALGIDKKGDNVKWKKHILDAIWHGDSFFESGTPILKQTGVWRLINPKVDPWLDSLSSSPLPRRKTLLHQKKMRGAHSLTDLHQEFATSEPISPTATPRGLGAPQSLPHISSLFRHVDDYWQSRSMNMKVSPPTHRRTYSPFPMEGRSGFGTSISLPPSPTSGISPSVSPEPIPLSPTLNMTSIINSSPSPPTGISNGFPSLSFPSMTANLPTPVSPVMERPIANAPILPTTVTIPPQHPTNLVSPALYAPAMHPQTLAPFSPAPISAFHPNHNRLQQEPLHPHHLQASSPEVMQSWSPTAVTRASSMLPCVSSLFPSSPFLPSIYPARNLPIL